MAQQLIPSYGPHLGGSGTFGTDGPRAGPWGSSLVLFQSALCFLVGTMGQAAACSPAASLQSQPFATLPHKGVL